MIPLARGAARVNRSLAFPGLIAYRPRSLAAGRHRRPIFCEHLR